MALVGLQWKRYERPIISNTFQPCTMIGFGKLTIMHSRMYRILSKFKDSIFVSFLGIITILRVFEHVSGFVSSNTLNCSYGLKFLHTGCPF